MRKRALLGILSVSWSVPDGVVMDVPCCGGLRGVGIAGEGRVRER